MLTLNETFVVPDAAHAWSVVNDLATLVGCVPGARVKSVEGPQAVKAEIAVRMGAMGMTFTGPVKIASSDAAGRTVTIKADTRETLGQSYATGDITIGLGEAGGTIDAVANVGGKAAGMGEGVIVNVLTDLVRAFSANVERAVAEVASGRADHAVDEFAPDDVAVDLAPATIQAAGAPAAAAPSPATDAGGDPTAIFRSLTSRFGGRLDVKLTTGPDDAPLLKATGQSFAMLHGGELVVRLHPGRCADLVQAGQGQLFIHDGRTLEDWFVVAGLDAAEWTAHTMEALACAKD
jgi:carbon monoxide dehydrogenase subunit G